MFYPKEVLSQQQSEVDDDMSIHLEVEPLHNLTTSDAKVESQEQNGANTQPNLQDNLLASDRQRRSNSPPTRFDYANVVAFALNVA